MYCLQTTTAPGKREKEFQAVEIVLTYIESRRDVFNGFFFQLFEKFDDSKNLAVKETGLQLFNGNVFFAVSVIN